MEKLFLSRLSQVRKTGPLVPEDEDPSRDLMAEYTAIKKLFQELPGCTLAMFTEELLMLSLINRIRLYVAGRVRLLGSRRNHGTRMTNDLRSDSERAGVVIQDIHLDFMRLAGLMDRGAVESIALTYHLHLFD
jgi:hypothetical protein